MKKLLLITLLAFAFPVLAETKVLVFAGSTRTDSYNKKLLHEAAEIAKEMGAKVTVIDLKDYPIPFYDADLEAREGLPTHAKRLRKLMIENEAILIASPEYNSSVTAVLKNAIDWVSRSEKGGSSREAFREKKFALMSASPGQSGGARGLIHLRAIIEDIGGNVISSQVTVPSAYNAFNEQGRLKDPKLKAELRELVEETIH